MKFYDMNMRGANYNHDLSMIKEASRFGWDYINLNYSIDGFKESLKYKEELIEEASRLERPVEIDMGINLRNSNSGEMQKAAKKYRNKTSMISCLGGDLKLNRSCLESYKLDVLSRPYFKRRDSGMNHVLAKEAVKHNVAVELCFRDILHNHLKYRANVIASFKEILMFHRKFNFPLILTTDSKSLYDIRSTRDMVAFFKSIGFTNQEIINGFYHYPKQIIDFNRERENMVVQGVKVIKGATDFSDVRHDDEENIDEGLYGDDVFFEDDSLGENLSLKYDEFCENDLNGEDEL